MRECKLCSRSIVIRGVEYAGTGEPGSQALFFARHFLCKKEKCPVNFVKQQKKCLEKCGSKGTHVLPGNYYEKMKSAWKKLEVKDLILPGSCYEKMISAWDSAGVFMTR